VLAEPLTARTDLPAFPTSSVDGWAVRGEGPWRPVGRVLAGERPAPLTADGDCVEIATGAMVPVGTTAIIRVENSTVDSDGLVRGTPRERPDWRQPGEEATAGEVLMPAGSPVTPGLVGLAASAGYDTLSVRRAPRSAVLVFGDELLTTGLPGDGRVRDALGPQVPAWLRRFGATAESGAVSLVVDTLDAHVAAISAALDHGADLICTTGGTMRGPVDHLHGALARLGATLLVDAVAVRPGYPMLLASLPAPDGRTALLAGLPGNPQSAVVGMVTLVGPLVAGWLGRPAPDLSTFPRVRLAAPVPGRGGDTHLALVRLWRVRARRAGGGTWGGGGRCLCYRGRGHDPGDPVAARRGGARAGGRRPRRRGGGELRRRGPRPRPRPAGDAPGVRGPPQRRGGAQGGRRGDHGRPAGTRGGGLPPHRGPPRRGGGAGRRGGVRAPGRRVRRLRPASGRGEGPPAGVETAGLRRRHRGVGQLPVSRPTGPVARKASSGGSTLRRPPPAGPWRRVWCPRPPAGRRRAGAAPPARRTGPPPPCPRRTPGRRRPRRRAWRAPPRPGAAAATRPAGRRGPAAAGGWTAPPCTAPAPRRPGTPAASRSWCRAWPAPGRTPRPAPAARA